MIATRAVGTFPEVSGGMGGGSLSVSGGTTGSHEPSPPPGDAPAPGTARSEESPTKIVPSPPGTSGTAPGPSVSIGDTTRRELRTAGKTPPAEESRPASEPITSRVEVPTGKLGPGTGVMVLRGRAVYRLLRSIGAGNMGTVYLAEVSQQPRDGSEPIPSTVAIKLLSSAEQLPGSTSHRVEVGVLRGLRHPNVVRIHDWAYDAKINYAVLDFHEHGSLFDQIRREGPLSAQTAHRLMHDLLSALVETHAMGILHLDIKPGNVLVGNDGRFLLTDFGIAQSMFQDGSKRIIGTPAFMSPEQARGENERLDARSDLFSLGATAWQAISGDFSFQRRPPMEVLTERKLGTLPKLVERVSDEYRALAAIVDRMLAFDPRNRPGSAAEVLFGVDSIYGGDAPVRDAAERGHPVPRDMRDNLRRQIADPVLRDLFEREGSFFTVRMFEDTEVICDEEERSYAVYILLHGTVEVLRHDKLLAVEDREGAVMGEVSALSGKPRTATLRARGRTVLASLNGAELEQAARRMPALAVRLMKGLAMRLAERDTRTYKGN